jgi:hypothetical protein
MGTFVLIVVWAVVAAFVFGVSMALPSGYGSKSLSMRDCIMGSVLWPMVLCALVAMEIKERILK